MTMPTPRMSLPAGSLGGFKTQQQYDDAWRNLADLNARMYGEESGRRTAAQALSQQSSWPSSTSQQAKPLGVDMSAYKPGAAQPVQPQSQGTPYGTGANAAANDQRWGKGRWAYSMAPAPQGGAAQTKGYGGGSVPQQYSTSSTTVSGDPRGGFAGMPAQYRPPPVQMAPAQTPWGQSMDPFAERDAFIKQINQQKMQLQQDYNWAGGTPSATWNATPQMNFGAALGGAGLSGGAPSMNPEYGDSLIARLNDQFGAAAVPQANGSARAFANGQSQPVQYYSQMAPYGGSFIRDNPLPASTTYAYPGGGWGHTPDQQWRDTPLADVVEPRVSPEERARREQDARELEQYRQRFPGLDDRRIKQAIDYDKTKQKQEAQDSWTEQYGTEAEKSELSERRRQQAAWERERAVYQKQKDIDDELIFNANHGGEQPVWDGGKYVLPSQSPTYRPSQQRPSAPGQARPSGPIDPYGSSPDYDAYDWPVPGASPAPGPFDRRADDRHLLPYYGPGASPAPGPWII